MVGLIARMLVKEGKMGEAIEAFEELMAAVAGEDGTLAYSLNRESDSNTLVMLERYRDKAALAVHSSTPHFKAFSAKAGGFLDGRPEITIMDEIASI
ncbi:MAG: antibiotic biosynthesis monooxygenase [Acidimicrobiia bacterium]|nr:antibiotic biosynthesis monooxygenase [Acidimicrobiia bacterium]